MDKLKLYAAPLLALVLLLAWFFVIRPMLAEDEAPSEDPAGQQRE
ncbi:MAG: hypothetical protein R6X02_18580 [Enhygromyxa sp.]